MNKEVLIIGAGKIGRGLIGHLFYKSGYKLWFVDASLVVVELLNKEKKYRIDIVGEGQDSTEYIAVDGAFTLDEREKVAEVLSRVEIIATSVGAGNIEKVSRFIKNILVDSRRKKLLNWIICENATGPAKKIKDILLENADAGFEDFAKHQLGLIETQVLRTGMPANEEVIAKEPLAVRMQDWWSLPLDKDAFVGTIPDVIGFDPKTDFANELLRKLYTFNGTNGPIAYIGWANGYKILHEAALAFLQLFEEIQEQCADGLINE